MAINIIGRCGVRAREAVEREEREERKCVCEGGSGLLEGGGSGEE